VRPSPLVYFAGPIDGVESGAPAALRLLVRQSFEAAGLSVFWPQSAYSVAGGERPPLQEVNVRALEVAAVVVADLASPARRVGTYLEVGWALARGVPVVALVSEELEAHLALDWSGVTKVSCFGGSPAAWAEAVASVTRLVAEEVKLREFHEWADELELGLGGSDEVEFAFDPEACSEPEAAYPEPSRAYEGDAGWDLPVGRRTVVPPSTFVDVPLAFRLAPPRGVWYRLVGRSSTLRKFGLMVNEGVIDSGYRGPLYAGVFNLGSEEVVLQPGMRVAQVIPALVTADGLSLRRVSGVAALRRGERGENGFGSTGVGGVVVTSTN
jgi:dUTP pyrophosphatase